jgi:choline monooxygenase
MSAVARLLGELQHIAENSLEQARALPPAIYTSSKFLNLEMQQIFARDWSCAGRAAEIPKPGDYLTWSIAGQPIFVARNSSGEVKAFSNVCRHRMMVLLEGKGSCKRVVCPYHAWTYDLDGQLIGAPYMDKSAGFDKKSIRLHELRTEIWEGWIYVTLNEDVVPVAELLAPLGEVTTRYRQANYVPVISQDHVWDTNWKLLTENFMEGYHLPVAHKETVGAWMPIEKTGFPDGVFAGFTYQTFEKNKTAGYGRAHAANTWLDGDWRHTSVLPTVFPCHMYVLAPDHLWYLSLRPQGAAQVQVRFGVALAPEVIDALEDRDAAIDELSTFFDKVNAEDRGVVEGIFKGAQAPLSSAGQLSWLERELHDFACYLNRRLAPGTSDVK